MARTARSAPSLVTRSLLARYRGIHVRTIKPLASSSARLRGHLTSCPTAGQPELIRVSPRAFSHQLGEQNECTWSG